MSRYTIALEEEAFRSDERYRGALARLARCRADLDRLRLANIGVALAIVGAHAAILRVRESVSFSVANGLRQGADVLSEAFGVAR